MGYWDIRPVLSPKAHALFSESVLSDVSGIYRLMKHYEQTKLFITYFLEKTVGLKMG